MKIKKKKTLRLLELSLKGEFTLIYEGELKLKSG